MKKVAFIGLAVVAFGFASCKKCEDCHYEATDGTGEVEIGELCGDALKDAEENGYMHNDTVRTIHCEEH